MYCGECGSKNKISDEFCGECGSKLENPKPKKRNKNPMSKKTKIIVTCIVAIVVALIVLFEIGNSLTSPKNIAKDYIEALIANDADKLYNYIEIDGDKTFVSKKIFKSIIEENSSDSNIVNYVITDVEYADSKFNAVVKFSYTKKDSSSEYNDTINLTKSKDKKLLFFDNWKIQDLSTSEMILENYKIEVYKDSKVTYAGVKVGSKYLDKELSTDSSDVYVLPQVFMSETEIKVELSNGLEIIDNVLPSKYYSKYKVNFDEDFLTDEQKNSIIDNTKSSINSIYTGIINNNDAKEIDVNIENKEELYNEIVSDLKSVDITLTSFEITDVSLSSADLDDNNDIKVDLRVKYKYSLKYENYDNEEKTNDGSSSDYITVVFEYKDASFNIKNIDELDLYFSKYF